jgi:hypothetical protein
MLLSLFEIALRKRGNRRPGGEQTGTAEVMIWLCWRVALKAPGRTVDGH